MLPLRRSGSCPRSCPGCRSSASAVRRRHPQRGRRCTGPRVRCRHGLGRPCLHVWFGGTWQLRSRTRHRNTRGRIGKRDDPGWLPHDRRTATTRDLHVTTWWTGFHMSLRVLQPSPWGPYGSVHGMIRWPARVPSIASDSRLGREYVRHQARLLAIRTWVADLSSRRKPATVHKVAGILRKVLGDAVDSGLIARNPAERVRLPRSERREMRFLTPAKLADLADTIDPRYRGAVILGGYAGLRAGEMFGLRAHRVDPLHQRVHIAEIATHVRGHLYVGPPKTRASHRTVPIPRFVAETLSEHLKAIGAGPDDLVFRAPRGDPRAPRGPRGTPRCSRRARDCGCPAAGGGPTVSADLARV